MAFNKIVAYILMLILLVAIIFISFNSSTPLFTTIAENVQKVLGFLGAPAPYNINRTEQATAMDSTHALLYSINKVAWFDTYNIDPEKDATGDKIAFMSKTFGDTTAVPLTKQRELIDMGSPAKEKALLEITLKILDCKKIYEDRGKQNSGCFALDFSDFKYTIDQNELKDFMKVYMKSSSCDDTCEADLKAIVGGIFNAKNYIFNMEDDGKISKGDTVNICAQKPEFLGVWKVYITDSESENICPLSKEIDPNNFGMKVSDFYLPQTIDRYDTDTTGGKFVKFMEDWTNTYGDPEYVLYYEVFPEGEDKYWQPNVLAQDVATVVGFEAFFALFDLIPVVGKAVGKVIKETPGVKPALIAVVKGIKEYSSEAIEKVTITGIKNTLESSKSFFKAIGTGIKDAPRTALERVVKLFAKKGLKEGIEIEYKLIKTPVKEALEKGLEKSLKEVGETEGKTIIEKATLSFGTTYEAALAEGVPIFNAKTGKWDADFIRRAQDGIKSDLIANGIKEETAEKISKEATSAVKGNIENGLNVITWTRVANDVNIKLPEVMKGVKEDYFNVFKEKVSKINNIPNSKYKKLIMQTDNMIATTLEIQKSDDIFLRELFGEGFDKSRYTDEQLTKMLDDKFEEIFKDINPIMYASGKTQIYLQNLFISQGKKKRNVVVALAVMSNHLAQSQQEKFIPLGLNAIGLRTPYVATTRYNDGYTTEFNYNKDKKPYVEFFNNYYGYVEDEEEIEQDYLRYQGLLPEVERYYLAILKDSGKTERLHLVSPCKADIIITKTTCECYGKPKEDTIGDTSLPPILAGIFEKNGVYETGTYNSEYGTTISNFDGKNKMLYTVGENGELIKECGPKSFLNIKGDNVYKPECLEFSIIRDESQDPNYCYHGKTSTGMQIADYGLNYGVPIAATVFLGPIGSFAGGVVGGVAYTLLLPSHQWPNFN